MLWLLRHGDAAEGKPDEARPLTERGVRESQTAGRALARLGTNIDACLSSPRVRALHTAQLACEPLGLDVETTDALAGEPFDPLDLAAGRGDVLLVGHDPSMSYALHDLTGAQVRLRKGGLAAVEKGELLVLLRPAELTAIAGAAERVS
jgi:phosphohistidine phosphatase